LLIAKVQEANQVIQEPNPLSSHRTPMINETPLKTTQTDNVKPPEVQETQVINEVPEALPQEEKVIH